MKLIICKDKNKYFIEIKSHIGRHSLIGGPLFNKLINNGIDVVKFIKKLENKFNAYDHMTIHERKIYFNTKNDAIKAKEWINSLLLTIKMGDER
jgi:hypothetical protein